MSQAFLETKEQPHLPTWSSRLLSAERVLHFFTTRVGGVSSPPFDTLNLGFSSQDDPAKVIANRKRVEKRFGLELRSLAIQVHGGEVLVLKSKNALPDLDHIPEADAILSNIPGQAIPIFFADCVPIFVWDPVRNTGGVIHAGWRSTVKDIGPRSVETLESEFGSRSENLLVALGPSIGPCCFEVGSDVARMFEEKFGNEVVSLKGDRNFVDLWEANRRALELKGVNALHMELARECTSCIRDRYFSYRRDKGKTGRMAGVIVIQSNEEKGGGST